MIRRAGRMLPGSGAGPFTGQSESVSAPVPRNARCRAPDFGPSIPPGVRRRVVSDLASVSVGGGALLVTMDAARTGVVSITVARRAAVRESTVSTGARGAEARVAPVDG